MTGRAQPVTGQEAAMLIDCDSCAMRDLACGDCVVTVMLGMPSAQEGPDGAGPHDVALPAPGRIELDGPERAAIAVLAGQGLVPPLRLVPRTMPGAEGDPGTGSGPGAGAPGQGGDYGRGHYDPQMLPGAETA